MNIIVKIADGRVYCRPDTTLEREDKDFYVPDGISRYAYAPVVFARVCKAGKCIGGKFADRYYDSFCFGVLLYTGDDLAFDSCHDRTSVLPGPLYSKAVLGAETNEFVLSRNGEEIFRCSTAGMEELIGDALVRASQKVSLRIGDYVAAELSEHAPLLSREEGDSKIDATFCTNPLFDFKVIF